MSTLKTNRIENLTTTDGGISINNSGQVGVGTTSPTANLHGSVSSGNFSTILESTATSGESSLVIGGKNSSGTVSGSVITLQAST